MTISKFFKLRFVILSLLIFISVFSILILKISISAKTDNYSPSQNKENQVTDQTSSKKPDKTEPDKAASNKIIVYYFYTTHRCYSCRLIEKSTKDAVETFFSDELKSGLLEYKPINIDEKGNEHFSKDYKLYTKSVVVSLRKDGKEISYKNLEKIWQYLNDENKFFNYIKEETEKMLKKAT